MALNWKGIGVESNKRVFRVMLFQGVVECQKTREIFRVGY